jgi:predicted DNA-binding transcriptional regulator YafY
MPVNKFALIRYKTIDNCLQNRLRKWTFEDLMDACSDALYEYEGVTKGISRRAIQLDIQTMRSEKLGYNAPIIVTGKKYYSYEEKGYSINNIPLTSQDLDTLNDVLGILKQFNSFGYFQELNDIVTRLDDKLYRQQNKGKSFIDFEKNELLRGLNHIDPLHKAIISSTTVEITYRSFKATDVQTILFSPYLLKEYRNRWFLLGANKKASAIMVLALDRIESFTERPKVQYIRPTIDVPNYFGDVIGVSKTPGQKPIQIILKIRKDHAPYIITKPMHTSQKIIREDAGGTTFSIDVIWNFELERELLGFGELIKVIAPRRLIGKIQSRTKMTTMQYMPPR